MLKDAIDELVNKAAHQEIDSAITVKDALEYVTPEDVAELAATYSSKASFVMEALDERISNSQFDTLFDYITNDPMLAGNMVQQAVYAYTADHIRREAQLKIDSYEPSDRDMGDLADYAYDQWKQDRIDREVA